MSQESVSPRTMDFDDDQLALKIDSSSGRTRSNGSGFGGFLGYSRSQSRADEYDSSDEDNDSLDGNGLPFPKPIQRQAFLQPEEFVVDKFLVSQHRYQRLEDLHSQLSNWSRVLQQELVELINRDYVDFVGLGKSVSGGANNVENMKMGLISFQREIEGISNRLQKLVSEIDEAWQKKREIRKQENLARQLLTYNQRLGELEILLFIDSQAGGLGAVDLETDEDFTSLTSLPRLRRVTQVYLYLKHISTRVPADHPFVVAQKARIDKVLATILNDLGNAVRECRTADDKKAELIDVLALYRVLGEGGEATKALAKTRRHA
ncbi:oligomeric golgi complex component, COG2-domain-containing protein [Dipodascopsis tothii]|uniref:oligomeric golgi complex component, COG2-domain-containing protein n=1 Tax=Dipodascopsis tothii TaxID=44089 RepID=UPI0034CF9DCE